MRVYEAYASKRAHMMEFIVKFRANAKRATMVQSRIKTVEKMDLEAPEEIEVDPVWRFSIPCAGPLGRPIISIDDVSFDYSPLREDGSKKDPSEFLLQKVNFGVDLSSRIAILGANGQGTSTAFLTKYSFFLSVKISWKLSISHRSLLLHLRFDYVTSYCIILLILNLTLGPSVFSGKTTLLNLIMGKIRPIHGNVSINSGLRIAHFTQHHTDSFDLTLSAVENMIGIFPGAEDQGMRSFLGKFQIQGNDALKPMGLLSGGQKSRVAFAALAYKKPHVLVIDEGSNHLSMDAADALVKAVQDFKGGLMVVSHDQHFVSNTCSELWEVHDGVATKFRGTFDEYKAHTSAKTAKRVEESVKRLGNIHN
jgi:ATP-binding cassette subfamily F protein 3